MQFHWLQAPLGVSLSVSFLFLPSCARVLEISPFALIKPGACYAGYNNLKAEPGNSVTNCILMSDPLVLFLNKNQRTSYIHRLFLSKISKITIFNQEWEWKGKITSPSCQFSFSSLVLDAISAVGKLQILHVRQLRFPTAPVCQEKKHSQIINLDAVFSIFRY